jgi:Ca2+-binding RTX toxin-like protein
VAVLAHGVLVAGPADAGTLSVQVVDKELVVQVSAGQAHQIRVKHIDGYLVVTDTVPLTAGPGCKLVSEVAVWCQEQAVASVEVTLGALADTLAYRGALPLTASGGDGDDLLTGGFGGDRLLGGAGKDTLSGGEGGDVLVGGAGEDHLYGGPGADTVYGDLTTPLSTCSFCADRLYGDDGDDRLSGGEWRDAYSGGPGDDALVEPPTDKGGGDFDGGQGDDVIIGSEEAMRDIILYTARTAPVAVDLAAGKGGEVGETDLISHVEDVHGGSGDDTITGDENNNNLQGNLGFDTITGGGGVDSCGGESISGC